MVKNIIKELIIFLLLILAIILILGVLLYKYVPANKIIPEKVSYTTPETVKTELQEDESVDNSEVIVTYKIDSTDLSNYKKIQEYVPGKKNPFASVQQTDTIQTNDSENSGTNSNNSSNAGTSTTETTNSNNTNTTTNNSSSTNNSNTGYLPDKGTK